MKKFLSIVLTLAMILSAVIVPVTVADAATMAEATFFAKLNYAGYPGLSAVKAAVDGGDYTTAKEELLAYYQDRKAGNLDYEIHALGIDESDDNMGMAMLANDFILTGPYEFDVAIGRFTVTSSSARWYSVDITDKVVEERDNQNISMMLFARYKQNYPVYVNSRESSNPPVLVVTMTDGTVYNINPDKDTYIHSGNKSTNYGTETVIMAKEGGSGTTAYDTLSRRGYMNFPLSTLDKSKTIESAVVRLNAYYSSDCTTGDKDAYLISVGDTTWSETGLTWDGINGSIYSWQNREEGPYWTSPSGCDGEYLNVTTRFWFAKPMAYAYLQYLAGNPDYADCEEYGDHLLYIMQAFVNQCSYGYNRTLETGERLNNWVEVVDALLDTPAMTPQYFYDIMSFIWGDCDSLNSKDITNGSYWWSNWRVVANSGFFKGTEYFPEFSTYSTFRSKVEGNMEYCIDLLYDAELGFTEAGPDYASWCSQLFGSAARMAAINGNPMSQSFIEKLKYATRYAAEAYFPNGYDTNIGDSNFEDQSAEFAVLADFLDDEILSRYATGDDSGTPEYRTSFYKLTRSAFMRNSWDPDEAVYVNFWNNPSDGHYHTDSNQVLFYAYGKPLIVDSGRYGYSGSDIYSKVRTAEAHNTVSVTNSSDTDLTMSAHSAASTVMNYAEANDEFDFASNTHSAYSSSSITHTRDVLFVHDGFAIVSDYMQNSGSSTFTYKQNWHFLPSSDASASGLVATTDFYNQPNLTIASAAADSLTIKSGYHSANYGLAAANEFAQYAKAGASGAEVKFDTILYPTDTGATATVTATELAPSSTDYSAVSFDIDGTTAYYYDNHATKATRTFGTYTYDGKSAFVMGGEYILVDGTTLKNNGTSIIASPNNISNISVTVSGSTVAVTGLELVEDTSAASAIAIYAPSATSVTLNGESISYNKSGNYVYAVASTSVETVTGTASVLASKDGFYAYSSGNEGANSSNSGTLQASCSWQNRNSYIGFDLTDYADCDITAATLTLYVTEAASGSTLQFYYMDYDEQVSGSSWSRTNLAYILNSSKMPTHTANVGTYTGHGFRFSGSVSGITAGNPVTISTNLPDFLTAYNDSSSSNHSTAVGRLDSSLGTGDPYKFTWAMISGASGSTKFASINNTTYPGPTLNITYSQSLGDEVATTVTTYYRSTGGATLKAAASEDATPGYVYILDADETITVNGTTYVLDEAASTWGAKAQKGKDMELVAVYKEAKAIALRYVSAGGTVYGTTSATTYEVGDVVTANRGDMLFWSSNALYTPVSDYSIEITDSTTSPIDIVVETADVYAAIDDFYASTDGTVNADAGNMIFVGKSGSGASATDADGNSTTNQATSLGSDRVGVLKFNKPSISGNEAVLLHIYVAYMNQNIGVNTQRIAAYAVNNDSISSSGSYYASAFASGGTYATTNLNELWSLEWFGATATGSAQNPVNAYVTVDVTEAVQSASGSYVVLALKVPAAGAYIVDIENAEFGDAYAGKAAYLEVVEGVYLKGETGSVTYTANGVSKALGSVVATGSTIKTTVVNSASYAGLYDDNGTKYTASSVTANSGVTDSYAAKYYGGDAVITEPTVAGNTLTVNARAATDYNVAQGTIYAAVFEGGVLTELRIAEDDEIASTVSAAAESFTFTNPIAGKTVTLFMWEDGDSLRPISNAYTYNVSQ